MSSVTTYYLKSDNEADYNKKVNNLLDKDPLMPIPPNFIGEIENKYDYFKRIEDRLNIKIEDFVPNEEDVERMVVAFIGAVPVIGPMMQGLFTLMSNKIKGNQREEIVTKETIKNMVDIEIAKVKNELINTIKEKVEKSAIDQKVKLCEKSYEGIKESHFESLYENLTHLKLRLLKKDVPDKNDSLLVGIRSQFDSLRKSLKILLSFSNDQVIIQSAPNLCVQIIGMYILTLNNLMYHWYQYGFDPEYALGTPADDEEPATHSYREKLHINIQNFLKQVQIATNTYSTKSKEYIDLLNDSFNFVRDEKHLNEVQVKIKEYNNFHVQDMENVDKIFESDPFYYPIPLIKEYELIKSDDTTMLLNKIKIQTSKKKGPCIYRIDGKHFSDINQKIPKKKLNIPNMPEIKLYTSDLTTKCDGKYLKYFKSSSLCIDIELDESRDIRIRCLFGHYKNHDTEMTCIVDENKKVSKGDYEVYPSITKKDYAYFKEYSKFGFFTTESYGKKNTFSLQVSLDVPLSKLTFCEIIVTDQ